MDTLRTPVADPAGELVKVGFTRFLQTFKLDDEHSTIQQRLLTDYMLQITSMMHNNHTTLYVDFQHVCQHDFELAEALEINFYRFEPYLRASLQEVVAQEDREYVFHIDNGQREFFVAFYNQTRVEKIRSMKTDKIGRLVSISGTVTRSSEVKPELLYGHFLCKKCGSVNANVEQQYQYTTPQVCVNASCTSNDFQLVHDQCTYVDWQRLRVQENADEIPAGSMPRCIDVICRNEIVENAKAGDKIVFVGSVAVISDTTGLSRAGENSVSAKTTGRGDSAGDGVTGLRKLGVKEMTYKLIFIACNLLPADEGSVSERVVEMITGENPATADHTDPNESMDMRVVPQPPEADQMELLAMVNSQNLYKKLADSICPSVFGHQEVKRGILLMLFGGVHKKTPEGINLRGDLNVCIVGDPSCAKSQFLKFVHGFLPHTVYTSGKSSSAAGLTASVVRDSDTGEHCIEAGAMMLADNGICCIDEFDKMDPADQVAIHEAMEQQTISITKAGIQATLNARASILAAANPVFGRYDRTKTLKANVNISPAIMSRFDLFFVILDECNPETDEHIARHIINSHRGDAASGQAAHTAPFTPEQLLKYIKFAKTLNPVITKDSRKMLVDCYRLLRQNDILGKNKTAYRITVRQLESLIRLSEALARLYMDSEIRPEYVKEAYRLLQKSIIFVETEDIELDENEEEMDAVERRLDMFSRADRGGGPDDDTDGEEPRGDDGAGDSDQGGDDNNDDDDAGDKHSRKRRHGDTDSHGAKRGKVVEESAMSASAADMEQSERTAEQESPSGQREQKRDGDRRGKNEKKKKAHISAKEYEDMTQMIILYVKKQEEREGGEQGVKWMSVVLDHLNAIQNELNSLEALEARRKIVNQVIKRMVKHDGSLILLGADGLDTSFDVNETRFLRVHPSIEL